MEALTTLFVTLLFGLAWQPPALPPVSLDDLRMFPGRDCVRREFARVVEYKRREGSRVSFHATRDAPGFIYWGRDLETVNWTYQVWDALDDATNVCWGEEGRIHRLTILRELIGARSYYHGWMPMIPGD